MRSFVAVLAALLVPSLASAQAANVTVDVSVEAPADASVDVSVGVHVATVEPPPVFVVLEPAVDAHVEPTAVLEPPPLAPAASSGVAPIVHARAMLLMSGDHDPAAWGGAAGVGLRFGAEWTGSLVAGYLTEIGGGPSEIDLGVEIARDFSPSSDLGFVVLAGLGTAFIADDPVQPDAFEGVRMMAQLGVGVRTTVFDPRVAISLDARAVLRYRPPELFDDGALTGGLMITMGLAIRMD